MIKSCIYRQVLFHNYETGYILTLHSDPWYVVKQYPRVTMYTIFIWHRYNLYFCVDCAVKIESESEFNNSVSNLFC